MNDEDRRLSGAYALDAVTDHERRVHEELMRVDAEAERETRSLTETAAALSHVTEQAPPPGLRRDTLAAIKLVRPLPPLAEDTDPAQGAHGEPAPEPSLPAADTDAGTGAGEPSDARPSGAATVTEIPRRRGWWVGAIAAAAAAIVAGVVVVTQIGEPTRSQAEAVISASDVTSHGAVVGELSVTLFVAPSEGKAVIAADEMPDAPEGRDFQVWLELPDGSMVDSGVMPRTGGGPQEFVVDGDLAEAEAIAITEEPAGGSPSGPTSDPFLRIELP